MPKLCEVKFAFLCDHALIDQQGKLGMLGIFQNINVQKLPATHTKFMFVIALNILVADKKEHNIKIEITGSSKIKNKPTELKFTFNKNGNMVILAELIGQQFDETGKHEIQIHLDNNLISQTEFDVIKVIPSEEN